MTSFLDAETIKKFVLKLVIPATDDTPEQIRRVKVSRITDTQGQISYEELVRLVMTFQPTLEVNDEDEGFENHNDDGQMSLASMTSSLKTKKSKVLLEYQDVDDDRVTIASTEELIDAMEQFQNKGLLRIITTHRQIVTMAPSSVASLSRSMAGVKSVNGSTHHSNNNMMSGTRSVGTCTSTIHTNRTTSSNPNATTATTGMGSNPANRTSSPHSMVNTIVGALADIVVSVEEGLNGQYNPPNRTTTEMPDVVPEPNKDDAAPTVEDQPNVESSTKSPPGQEKEEDEEKVEGTPNNDQGIPNKNNNTTSPPLFIHGRHTCDSCLVTPIIGNRYHATNLPDYDVCQVCFDNYQGTEIQFETAQHERDVPFQARWNLRKERVEAKMMRHGRGRCGGGRGGGRGRGPGRRCGGGGRGGGRGRRFGRWNMEPQVYATPTTPTTTTPPPPPQDFDHALTEAIRRSLEDAGPTNKEEEQENEGKVVVNVTTTTASEPNPPTAPMEEEIVIPAITPQVNQTLAPSAPVEEVDGKVNQSNLKPPPPVSVETVAMVEDDEDEDTKKPGPVQPLIVSKTEDALDMVADVIDEMMQDAYAKFQAAELNVETPVKDNDDDKQIDGSVASDSSASNEWQMLVNHDEDEDETMMIHQQTVATVTEEQRQRWFAQLSQLREIGFHDEGKCVETLERLHAANIGSDVSDEEVSVTRVVNEMLKQNK